MVLRWSGLPEHLVAVILRTAFQDSDRALAQWVRLSLVCRRPMQSSRCPAHSPKCVMGFERALRRESAPARTGSCAGLQPRFAPHYVYVWC